MKKIVLLFCICASLFATSYVGEYRLNLNTDNYNKLNKKGFVVDLIKLNGLLKYKILKNDDLKYINSDDFMAILSQIKDVKIVKEYESGSEYYVKVSMNFDAYTLKKMLVNIDKSILYNKGVYLLKHKKVKDGVKQLAVLYKQDSQFKNINYVMALVSANVGNTSSEIYYYKQELNIHPDHVECIHNLAQVYLKLKDYDKSLNYYSRLLAVSPNYKRSLKEVSYIYFLKGDYSNSLSYYKKYITLNDKKIDPSEYQTYLKLKTLNGKNNSDKYAYSKKAQKSKFLVAVN